MRISLCLLAYALLTAAAPAQPPNFDYAYFVTNSEGYIVENNLYTTPCFGDWDDDGDPDMMVGVLFYGYIYYYQNVAVGGEPVFAPHSLVTADGSPISVSYG